jgi:hypothetical protein
MVGRELTLMLGGLLLLGCASGSRAPEPEPPSPQTVTHTAPTPAPDDPPPPSRATEPATRPPQVVVIEPGGREGERQGLVAAALAERQRRSEVQAPVAIIDDDNPADYAEGGRVTYTQASIDDTVGVAEVEAEVEGEVTSDAGRQAESSGEPVRDEKWWRQRVLDLRHDWREAEERIQELERRVSDLRLRFYAEDDPHVRDGQIKPSWDYALEALEVARRSSRSAERRLEEVLAEGAQAGALPGWLREGIDLEPERRAEERPRARGEPTGELQIVEPVTEDDEDDWR